MVLNAAIWTDIDTNSTGITFLRIDPDRSVNFGDGPFRAGLQAWALLTLNTDGHPRLGIGESVNLQTAFFGIIHLEEGESADYLAGLTT
jgi:hypothetical protein